MSHPRQSNPKRRWAALLLLHRGKWLLVTTALGASLGVLLAAAYGKNLSGTSIGIPGVGVIHRIALPKGVVSRSKDLWSVQLKLEGGDDFVRAYVNNYILASNENYEMMVHWSETDERKKEAVKLLQEIAVHRGHNRGIRPADFFLRAGLNHFVIELENRTGPCATEFQLRVNDVLVRGHPTTVPASFEEIDNLTGNTSHGSKGRRDLTDVLCSRHILQFELEK